MNKKNKTFFLGLSYNAPKDACISIVCIAIAIAVIIFFFLPATRNITLTIGYTIPFINIISNAINDISEILGLIFKHSILIDKIQTLPQFNIVSLLNDLTKMFLLCIVRGLIFKLFSFLFLHSKNPELALSLEKNNTLFYKINKVLLEAFSILIASIPINILMHTVYMNITQLGNELQISLSTLLFLFTFLLTTLYTYFIINRGTLKYNIRKTVATMLPLYIIPELFNIFICGTLFTIFLNCMFLYGWNSLPLCLLIGIIIIAWKLLEQFIIKWIFYKFRDIPYLGKDCFFTTFAWLPATLTLMAVFFTIISFIIFAQDPSYAEGMKYLLKLPFIEMWFNNIPIFDIVMSNPIAYISEWLPLLTLCTIGSMLQYISSSYKITLYTQIFLRPIIMSILTIIILLLSLFIVLCVEPFILSLSFPWFASIIAIILYAIFIICQPHLALQGIVTTILIMLLMQHFPISYILNGNIYSQLSMQSVYILSIVLYSNIILSLIQNVICFFEKKKNNIKK